MRCVTVYFGFLMNLPFHLPLFIIPRKDKMRFGHSLVPGWKALLHLITRTILASLNCSDVIMLFSLKKKKKKLHAIERCNFFFLFFYWSVMISLPPVPSILLFIRGQFNSFLWPVELCPRRPYCNLSVIKIILHLISSVFLFNVAKVFVLFFFPSLMSQLLSGFFFFFQFPSLLLLP